MSTDLADEFFHGINRRACAASRIGRISSTVVFLFIVLCAESIAEQNPNSRTTALASKQLQVTRVPRNDFLSLRSAPSSESAILARIPYDETELRALTEPLRRKDAVWIGVTYRGINGYVNAYYVEIQEKPTLKPDRGTTDHINLKSNASPQSPITPINPVDSSPERSTPTQPSKPSKPLEPWLVYSIVTILIILCAATMLFYLRGWRKDFKTSFTSFLLTFLLPSAAAYAAYRLDKCTLNLLGLIVIGSALLHVFLHLYYRCKNCGGLYSVHQVRSDFLRQELSEITETRNNHSYQKIVPLNVHEAEYECRRCGNRYTQIERHRA